MNNLFIVCLIIIITGSGLFAQNIETITYIPKAKVSGGINVMTSFYAVDGRDARRSPFSYVVSGNTRFKFGLLKVPVSFSFRDQRLSYGASFNKFGLSPYYKWIKVHLGHRSMRFSKYSLMGKNFFGVGTELTPGKWRFSAFRGTFQNHLAQRDTLVYGAELIDTYKRRAWGVKLGYGTSRNYLDLFYLKVKDDVGQSLPDTSGSITSLDPAENMVLGTDWSCNIWRGLSLKGSLNLSAFTENTYLNEISSNGVVQALGSLVKVNPSTKVSFAGELGVRLNLTAAQLGLNYKRIEPNYRSLGTPYIQSDLEAYTAQTSFYMFQRKLNFNLHGGIERNNLRNLDYLGRKRLIGSIRAGYIGHKNFVANLSYSNYQYEFTDGLVELNDTLRYVNVNQSIGGAFSYKTRSDIFQYGAFLNVNRMTIKDQSLLDVIDNDIISTSSSLGVILEWKEKLFSVRPTIILNQFKIKEEDQQSYGLGLKVKKQLYDKKLTTSISSRFTLNDKENQRDGHVFSNSLSLFYKMHKNHSLRSKVGWIHRKSRIRSSYSEWRGNISYGFRF